MTIGNGVGGSENVSKGAGQGLVAYGCKYLTLA